MISAIYLLIEFTDKNQLVKITQCIWKSPFHKAGPKVRTGFILAPVKGPYGRRK